MSQQQLATLAKLRAEKDAAAKAAAELWHAALRGDAVAVEHVLHDTPGMTEDTSQSVSALHHAHSFLFYLRSPLTTRARAWQVMERTPLITAAEAGHEEIVKCLIEAGACVEAKDKDGETALVCAARNRHEAIVRLLIEAGASTMAKDLLNRPLIKAYPDVLRGASLSPSRSGDRPQLRREETERTPVERLSASTTTNKANRSRSVW